MILKLIQMYILLYLLFYMFIVAVNEPPNILYSFLLYNGLIIIITMIVGLVNNTKELIAIFKRNNK